MDFFSFCGIDFQKSEKRTKLRVKSNMNFYDYFSGNLKAIHLSELPSIV